MTEAPKQTTVTVKVTMDRPVDAFAFKPDKKDAELLRNAMVKVQHAADRATVNDVVTGNLALAILLLREDEGAKG